MASLADLQSALVGADAAGDTAAATTLATEIKRLSTSNAVAPNDATDAHGFRPKIQLDEHGFRPGTVGMQILPSTADVGMGARQVIDAGAQLATRGLSAAANAIAPDSSIAQWLQGQRQNVEAINQHALDDYGARYGADRPGAAFMRGLGQTAVTAPMTAMRAAATLPGIIGQGAAIGGVTGAFTPVYNPTDFAGQKLRQVGQGAAIGAATAGVFGLAGKAVAPNVRPEVQAMLDEGITPTPGQMMGSGFKSAEEKMTSLPIVGDAIKSSQGKALDEYNVALYNRILRPIGETYQGPAGQQGIAAVGDKLSAAYEDALSKSVPNVVTDEFRQRMNSLASMVPEAKRADFISNVNRVLKVTEGNTLTPSVAKDAESELGRLTRNYMGGQGDDRLLSNAYQQAQAELRGLVAQNNPDIAPVVQNINKGWSDLVQLENAANSTKVARAGGVVTPADQLRGIKRSDFSVRDRRFARGEMPNQDFAQAADSVLSNKYPDSGSIGRLLMNSGLTGLLGGGAALEPTIGAPAIAGGALASLPYLPGGRQFMAALLARRPELAAGARDVAMQAAPYLGGLAGGLLAGRQ